MARSRVGVFKGSLKHAARRCGVSGCVACGASSASLPSATGNRTIPPRRTVRRDVSYLCSSAEPFSVLI